MRKLIAALMTVAVAAPALAQQSSAEMPIFETERPKESGVRVALTYTSLNSTAKAPGQKVSNDLGQGVGASVGYASLPVGQLGYLTSLNLATIDAQDSSNNVNFARAELNVAYAINPRVFLKAGANVSDITNSDANVKPGVGGQIGIGSRTTPRFGFEVNFISMNQTNETALGNVDLTESGLELGISGTF
jgi:hypothetical protein